MEHTKLTQSQWLIILRLRESGLLSDDICDRIYNSGCAVTRSMKLKIEAAFQQWRQSTQVQS